MALTRFMGWISAWRQGVQSLAADFKKDPDGTGDPVAAAPLDDEFLDELTRTAPWIHHRRRAGNPGFRKKMAPWVDRSQADAEKED